MRKLTQELARHNTPLGAYPQFCKDLRALDRKYFTLASGRGNPSQFIGELNQHFRMYLVREFLLPAHEWSSRADCQITRTDKAAGRNVKQDGAGSVVRTHRVGIDRHRCPRPAHREDGRERRRPQQR